ncbi:Chorismate mutase, type II [Kalmanozyma brasiliensis GHG001]|uniref:chorismate mutase n=1 Tax=Kalmanozyma brasiliensis (strain GHG001) TaxID=1365824 RepID=V5ECK7_KALBG|nr:Chorismate mutase, type II [Kalmanozyma brasiliensis GHG001]EST08161.1 Chorismate mutase, type II [Kalmanozyma brasiliensis GHG001]
MKLLLAFTWALLAISSVTCTDAITPDDRLTVLRAQLDRYETSLIHAFLSRLALGGSVVGETGWTGDVLFNLATPQPDPSLAAWLKRGGSTFDVRPWPVGTVYKTPVVLPRDAILDQPVVGQGIFPIGRRPQDPPTVARFFQDTFTDLPINHTLDPGAVALLDASLLRLASARMLIGYQVGLAKFEWQHETFCAIFANRNPRKRILELIVDHKQEVKVLGRVQEKAKAWSKLFAGDEGYPDGAEAEVLRLFQAYLIPVTTAIEVQAIEAQASRC